MDNLITANYPSNIALVKYWGKTGVQRPCNANLSLTLHEAATEVKLFFQRKKNKTSTFDYLFEGKPAEAFGEKVLRFLKAQEEFLTFVKTYDIRIESQNSFPHSAGIASSASAFAAIAASFLKAVGAPEKSFKQKASHLARLGSGSACRSLYGPYAEWGKLSEIAGSSDDYAIPVTKIHPEFETLQDAILIVDDRPKKISSSTGHALMKHHPFAHARFADANKHCADIISILRLGDFQAFISITEREALSLHAMMMTSRDYYFLIKPQTVHVLEQVFRFRQDTHLPLCFSLDAGPNVHLLYPKSIADKVISFVEQHLRDSVKSIIYDHAGKGGSVN